MSHRIKFSTLFVDCSKSGDESAIETASCKKAKLQGVANRQDTLTFFDFRRHPEREHLGSE